MAVRLFSGRDPSLLDSSKYIRRCWYCCVVSNFVFYYCKLSVSCLLIALDFERSVRFYLIQKATNIIRQNFHVHIISCLSMSFSFSTFVAIMASSCHDPYRKP